MKRAVRAAKLVLADVLEMACTKQQKHRIMWFLARGLVFEREGWNSAKGAGGVFGASRSERIFELVSDGQTAKWSPRTLDIKHSIQFRFRKRRLGAFGFGPHECKLCNKKECDG